MKCRQNISASGNPCSGRTGVGAPSAVGGQAGEASIRLMNAQSLQGASPPPKISPLGTCRSNAPGGSFGFTPRGRCRLAATVQDQLPPFQPLSRTAPQCPGPGRKRVHPGPHYSRAAELKRREPLPARLVAQETSATLTGRCGRGRGGARAPGWGDRRGRAGWLRGRGPGGWGLGLAGRPGELGVGG